MKDKKEVGCRCLHCGELIRDHKGNETCGLFDPSFEDKVLTKLDEINKSIINSCLRVKV